MSSIITSIFAIMTLFLLQYFHYLPKVSFKFCYDNSLSTLTYIVFSRRSWQALS